MAKTNKVARHRKLNKIAAILQEMDTQYVKQFLPGRGRAEQWQQLSPGAGLYTPPHMLTSPYEKPVLENAPINFLGF
jgi:hypothetical protein